MPVVEDFDGEAILDQLNVDNGTLGIGMTQDVGEALLDYAVRALSRGGPNVSWYGVQP